MSAAPVLPLTYDECRARFRRAAAVAGTEVRSDPIEARGREGQHLTVDSTWVGDRRARRVLVVSSGVHGVEGFVGSALQCDLLHRLAADGVPDGVGVLLVHAVNPWGMSWWRRQNESNVDLNRNWDRDRIDPPANDAYDELHPLACPDTEELPDVDALAAAALAVVAERGEAWVRDGITRGQYRHPAGLHFGGTRTEASTRIVEDVVGGIGDVELALVLDLHTGHGPRGTVTLLSDQPPGSDQDRFLRRLGAPVEATVGNADATTGLKSGQISNGIRDRIGPDRCHATSVEFGTASDLEQLAATYLESWVHRHGDPARPDHARVVWDYRCCFTPDDPDWALACLGAGAQLLDRSLAAVAGGPDARG
jgi:predicted deacylase